jgi:hypothetical protein
MKQTKIMLAVMITFMLTWGLISFIGFALSDTTFKECMSHPATLIFMLVFGWFPAYIVGEDLNNL